MKLTEIDGNQIDEQEGNVTKYLQPCNITQPCIVQMETVLLWFTPNHLLGPVNRYKNLQPMFVVHDPAGVVYCLSLDLRQVIVFELGQRHYSSIAAIKDTDGVVLWKTALDAKGLPRVPIK